MKKHALDANELLSDYELCNVKAGDGLEGNTKDCGVLCEKCIGCDQECTKCTSCTVCTEMVFDAIAVPIP